MEMKNKNSISKMLINSGLLPFCAAVAQNAVSNISFPALGTRQKKQSAVSFIACSTIFIILVHIIRLWS